MKYPKFILIIMLILPWLSLPLLGKDSFKRFFPATLFLSLVLKIEGEWARKRKWWWYYETLHPKLSGGFPLIWGPFFIGAMWILKFFHGKFWAYTFFNFLIDSLFTFVGTDLLKKYGLASLIRLKKYQLSILFFIKSMILYGVQTIREKYTL